MAGSLISGRVSDFHRSRFTKSHEQGSLLPEHRLRLQIPGMLVCLSGVLMYGWFVHFRVHVASVLISTAIGKLPPSLNPHVFFLINHSLLKTSFSALKAAFGMTWVFITTTSYLTESFKETPATLVALASLFRNPAAAVAAVVVRPLIDRMGIGWCFTGMALMELGCVASISYLMVYSKEMRTKLESRNKDQTGKVNP